MSSHPAVLNTLEELKVTLSADRLGPPKQALNYLCRTFARWSD